MRRFGTSGQAALFLAVILLLSGLAARAQGDGGPVAISSGGADWGLKESFRNYIVGSIAHGSIAVRDGASVNPDGSFHFPLSGGSYDPESQTTVASFAGGVHFSGHQGQLELDVSGLSVELTPEGSGVFADVVSESLDSGQLISYPNVNLAVLDLSGVEPVEAGGTTSWTAVPAALSEAGAPAFAGFYQPRTELDPFSFSYAGPGGKPQPETWTAPGSPGFEQVAADSGVGSAQAMFVDRADDLLHVVSTTGLRALDLDDLALAGSTSAAELPASGYAFDLANATVFAAPDSTAAAPVRAFAWNAGSGEYDEEELPIEATKTTLLAYDSDSGKLFAIDGSGFPATADSATVTPSVAVAQRQGGAWTALSYPPLASDNRGISGLAWVAPGKFVATRHAHYSGTLGPTTILPSTALQLTDTGSSLAVAEIPGTTPPAPPAGGFTFGYSQPQLAPDGSVVLVGGGVASTMYMLSLDPGAGGFTAGTPLAIGESVYSVAIDGVSGSRYASEPQLQRATVIEDGAITGRISTPPQGVAEFQPMKAAADDGVFYFQNNVAPTRIFAYKLVGHSPRLLSEPEDVIATVVGDATTPVSFAAGAGGEPQPQVRWQLRPPGATAWSDLPGATATTLDIDAGRATAGNRYRAVFSNPAGEIASRAARLSVQVQPEPARDGGGGDDSAGSGVAPKGAEDGGPAVVPQPRPRRPLLKAPAATLAIGRSGVVVLARVTCRPPLPCALKAPRRTRVRIAGRAYWLKVLAPRAVRAGRSAAVRVRLPRPARQALGARRARVKVPVVVSSGEQKLARTLRATLKGAV